MSYPLIDDSDNHPLAIVVETVASSLLRAHPAPICLEVDIDHDIRSPVDAPSLCQLLDSVIRQALLEMSDGGELTITGCQTTTGVEIELADTGRDVESRACKLPMIAAAMSADVRWQNCPQGGGAVTVCIPFYRQRSADQQRNRRAA
ncbi:MAG: ATPase [Planctomycetota bacterium]